MLLKLKFSVHKVAKSWFEWTRSNCRSHPHSYTHIHISIQNFGEYSDPLPSHPPQKKSKYWRHWSVFLPNFVAHTFQRTVWYCVVWVPAQAVLFPTTDVTNLSRAFLQGDENFQLRSSFRENWEGQLFENDSWFVSVPRDMWYLRAFLFLGTESDYSQSQKD